MSKKNKDVAHAVTDTADVSKFKLFDSQVTYLKGVRVFDVGQGDCIGLRDQNDSVFCYIDYGGLNDRPDVNNPSDTTSRMPVQHNGALVSIILTHWDKDHYWSANKKNPGAQKCDWLVPRQKVSPQAVLFARNLGNAKCWPESRGNKPKSFGVGGIHEIQIRKCRQYDPSSINEDRNQSGLAISLQQLDDSKVEMIMLLPGDCPFDKIPHIPSAPIRALVAYHHGSRVHWTHATMSAIRNTHTNREMMYSFGKNSFGHPCRSNYRPEWDKHSMTTAQLRKRKKKSQDIGWK